MKNVYFPEHTTFLCRLRSIAAHRDHFVWRVSVRPSVRLSLHLSGSHILVVTLIFVVTLYFAGDTCIPWIPAIPVYAIHAFCT